MKKFFLFFFCAFLPLLMAPTGGIPSRPIFQQVTVKTAGATSTDIFVTQLGAAANNRIVRLRNNGAGNFQMGAFNDALSTGNNFLSATFSGATPTIDTLNLTATAVQVNGVTLNVSQNVYKSATTIRTATTTKSNDPDLIIAIAAAGNYAVRAFLTIGVDTTGTQSFVFSFDYSGTKTLANWRCSPSASLGASQVLPMGTGAPNQITAGAAFLSNALPTELGMDCVGTILATGAGNYALNWGPLLNNATLLSVRAGSYLQVQKI